MNNPLVLEQRVNKLGHVVTKHVRSTPTAPKEKASLPAPQVVSPAAKARKRPLKPPTASQLARKKDNGKTFEFDADDRLVAAIGTNGVMFCGISDVKLFELFSVVSPENALALASKGIEGPAEAVVDLLERKGLGDLVLDRREMMAEAVSRRVKPMALRALSQEYDLDAFDPDLGLDVAALLSD